MSGQKDIIAKIELTLSSSVKIAEKQNYNFIYKICV